MLPYDWLMRYLHELAVYTAKTVDSHIKYNQFSNPRESKAEASCCSKRSDIFLVLRKREEISSNTNIFINTVYLPLAMSIPPDVKTFSL